MIWVRPNGPMTTDFNFDAAVEKYYQPKKNTMSKFGKISWMNVKSAIVHVFLLLVTVFVLSIIESVVKAHTIFGIDWKHVVDIATMATLSVLMGVVSLLKNLLTTQSGNFMGIVKVAPDPEGE